MFPIPFNIISAGYGTLNNFVPKVEMENIRTGIEGVIAVIQRGRNGEISANISIGFTGVFNSNDFIDVVFGYGLTEIILFALCGTDDGHQNLILFESFKTAVTVSLLFVQLNFNAACGEDVGGIIGIVKVCDGAAGNGDGRQSENQT